MSEKIVLLTVGSDPEFFIKNIDTNEYISSLNLIPGSKSAPEPLYELGKGFSIQKDNVLLEFCVPPVEKFDDLYNNIKKAINYVNNNLLPDNFKIVSGSGAEYAPDQLDNEYARTFGCDVSYNAWTFDINHVEDNDTNYRSSGFHIHIGYENPTSTVSAELVKYLDLFIGVPSVLFDDDLIRRKQYGRAGEFRLTSYGVEYRVLGGYVMNSKDFFDAAMAGLVKAIDCYNSGFKFNDEQSLNIQTAINNNNTGLAEKLIEEFKMHDLINKVLIIE